MAVIFHKLHSSGNDFIVLSEKENGSLDAFRNDSFIKKICHRHLGIGADGLFFVDERGKVSHYDPDGSESFCVNGSLCLAYLKGLDKFKGVIPDYFTLSGVKVDIKNSFVPEISFALSRLEIREMTVAGYRGVFVDIGNPHFFIKGEKLPKEIAKNLRFNSEFKEGANVSFFEELDLNTVKIATFERGVEDFTLACGSACAAFCAGMGRDAIKFLPPSGMPVEVRFENNTIIVKGEVDYVAKGSYFF